MKFIRNAGLALLVNMVMFGGGQSIAQDYPTKPIRLIVPFAPGGGSEILAFIVRDDVRERLGQTLVVDFRPGGTGAVGSQILTNAPADGYTLLHVTSSTHAIFPNVVRKPPFDPVKDVVGVILGMTAPSFLFVHPSVPANSVKEFVAYAKSKPGMLNFGTPTAGGVGHMAAELFQLVTGTKLTHVPYKGSAPVLRALLGGEVQIAFMGPGSSLVQVQAKKLKILASGMQKRLPWLPDVPTFVESGYPTMLTYNWMGIAAKAGTPDAIVNKLNAEIATVLARPHTANIMLQQGYIAATSTPAEFTKLIRDDNEKWRKVAKDTGVLID